MHLTNVVQGRMRLVAVARAKIDEESVTNGLVSKTQYFTLDFRAKSKGVRADICNAEACWLKFHRSILKGEVEDFCSDLLFSESTKVCSAMECGEVVCHTCTICHGPGGLRKFDVVLSSKGGGSWICDCDKIQKADRKLHAHEFDILTTLRDGPINNGWEDGRVGGIRGVDGLRALRVVET